jgi:hypothetical protein
MPTRVRFRFNKVTGEVEELLVDDQDRRLPEAEHDRIASEVGELLAVDPRIHEAQPEAPHGGALREAAEETRREAEGPEREAG